MCVIPQALLRERMGRSATAAQRMLSIISERLERKERIHMSLARDGAAG